MSLTRYLSKRIFRVEGRDMLLSDWGIYHLHLGADERGKRFVTRTKELLFVHVTDDRFHMIAIGKHGDWNDLRLLQEVHDNWPEALQPFRRQGVLSDTGYTEELVKNCRQAGLRIMHRMSDGTVYMPPGGGYATDGTSTEAVTRSDQYSYFIWDLEEHVRNNIPGWVAQVREAGATIGPRLRLRLRIVDGKIFVEDELSRVQFALGRLP